MGKGASVETETPGESRLQQLLPRPIATAPAADSNPRQAPDRLLAGFQAQMWTQEAQVVP